MKRHENQSRFSLIRNQDGSVIIVVLLILVVVTIIGISASSTSTVEIQIATNDQNYRISFYNAESGLFSTPKLISRAINESEKVSVGSGSIAPGLSYLTTSAPGTDLSENFYRQLTGYDAYDNGDADVSIEPGGIPTEVDVMRASDAARHMAGGGVEFLTGYEGVGVGSAGGVAIFYDLNSVGSAPRGSTSTVSATYRKVLGIPGGL